LGYTIQHLRSSYFFFDVARFLVAIFVCVPFFAVRFFAVLFAGVPKGKIFAPTLLLKNLASDSPV
jgi:hypothetical protein